MNEDLSKMTFVFVFQLDDWVSTLARIFSILFERSVEVNEFHYPAMEMQKGSLLICCRMEKDRIGRTVILLDSLPGVVKLDWMDSKRRGSRF